jgi:hypothetical protein
MAAYTNRTTVDSHGSPTTDANGQPTLTPDTKVTNITATALPGHIQSDQYSFTKSADGSIQMQKTATAAQRAMAAANKAYQVGDLKNAGPLMQAAMTMQQQEATQTVTKIMQDPNMSQDEKVGALAKTAGATAYKAENGSYIVPGLGPQDANGNPAPMSYQQVAGLASYMTTPEGLQHAMEFNVQNQQLQQAVRGNDIKQQQVNTEGAEATADINQKNAMSKYYGANAEAQQFERTQQGNRAAAEASKAAAEAKINQQLDDIQKQAAALDPKSPDYKTQMAKLLNMHNMLSSRVGGKMIEPDDEKPEKPEQITPGVPYTDGRGNTFQYTYDGQKAPVKTAQDYDALAAKVNADKVTYRGFLPTVTQSGKVGIMLAPYLAQANGLPPGMLYGSVEEAQSAINTSPQNQRKFGLGGAAPDIRESELTPGGNGIPQ